MEDNKAVAAENPPCNCHQSDSKMIRRVITGIVVIALVMAAVITISSFLLGAGPHPFELKLFFAIGILTGLALLFTFAIAVYVWGPQGTNGNEPPGKVVFDACVKVIPPIITLILGAYFGISSSNKDETKPPPSSNAKTEQAQTASAPAAATTMDKAMQKNNPQHSPIK